MLDRLIGWAEPKIGEGTKQAEYCHAAIVGYGSNIIEARWPKVRTGPLDLLDLEKRNPVEIYRVKDITYEQQQAVVGFALGDLNKWYDVGCIFTLGFVQLGHAGVCSEYVWRWFVKEKIVLCDPSNLISPDDLAGSPIITRVQ